MKAETNLVEFLKTYSGNDEIDKDFYFETMYELTDKEFPNCPFSISLPTEELIKLDKPFTDQKTIVIRDDRACSPFKYIGFSEGDPRRELFSSYTIVTQRNGQPITLRQVLKKMITTPEYHKMCDAGVNHRFLESIYEKKTTSIQYGLGWGS